MEVPCFCSNLVKSSSATLWLSILFIVKYKVGHCGYQELLAVFTTGHFPWGLQGNLNCSCLHQAVASSYCWEKSSKCQWGPVYSINLSHGWNMRMALLIADKCRLSCNLPSSSSTFSSHWGHLQVCAVSRVERFTKCSCIIPWYIPFSTILRAQI